MNEYEPNEPFGFSDFDANEIPISLDWAFRSVDVIEHLSNLGQTANKELFVFMEGIINSLVPHDLAYNYRIAESPNRIELSYDYIFHSQRKQISLRVYRTYDNEEESGHVVLYPFLNCPQEYQVKCTKPYTKFCLFLLHKAAEYHVGERG